MVSSVVSWAIPLRAFRRARVAAGFNGPDAVGEGLSQRALTDGSEHAREHPSLEVFALTNDDEVHVDRSVGLPPEGVGVARSAAKRVGVGGREFHPVGIGPVVMQTFPDTARTLGDVGLTRALVMHLEVRIDAVCKELRPARSEVGEPGDELLGGRRGRLVEVDRGHRVLLAGRDLVLTTTWSAPHGLRIPANGSAAGPF